MQQCGTLTEDEIRILCDKLKDLLVKENNILIMQSPITVVSNYGIFFLSLSFILCYPCIYIWFVDLRRYSRSILRFVTSVWSWWNVSGYKLFISWRFRGSWIFQFRNNSSHSFSKAPISWTTQYYSRKSREQTNHTSIWLLRRVFAKV